MDDVFFEKLTHESQEGDDVVEARHPFYGLTIDGIADFISDVKSRYPNYELYFELAKSPEHFGPQINWWELRGVRRES